MAALWIWFVNNLCTVKVIQAIIALAVSFGLQLTSGQVGALTAATAAVLAFLTQAQVTPIVNPKDSDGNQLVPAGGAKPPTGGVSVPESNHASPPDKAGVRW